MILEACTIQAGDCGDDWVCPVCGATKDQFETQ
ncbi:MAG: rubredoxin [Gloeocapsa sp. UFS-A4-WI-NPMV-4B04]|nr:rubredoxin [Gloeocapsa sp. UFS-A4-WI-NPMV-4B04]